ncbi:hypothetical protein K8R43_03880 [archaeon]|nr:hypothetical protein [archaeon]
MNTIKIGHAIPLVMLVIGIIVMSGCIDGPEDLGPSGTPSGDNSGTSSMDENKPIKCIFEVVADEFGIETTRTSIVYMADGQTRFDTIVKKANEDETHDKYVILGYEWMYSWGNSGILPGTKIKLSEEEKEANKKIYAVPGLNGQGYDCEYWTPVNNSKFVPPTDVEFNDRTK